MNTISSQLWIAIYLGGVYRRTKVITYNCERCQNVFNLDIRVLSESCKINKDEKTITIKNVNTDETYNENMMFLILSPGAKPIVPPIRALKKRRVVYVTKCT